MVGIAGCGSIGLGCQTEFAAFTLCTDELRNFGQKTYAVITFGKDGTETQSVHGKKVTTDFLILYLAIEGTKDIAHGVGIFSNQLLILLQGMFGT